MRSIINVVEVVKAVESHRRIPDEFKALTFFSQYDLWIYDAVLDNKLCPTCLSNEATPYYFGNELRPLFPHLVILDDDTIGGEGPSGDGLAHPNCRCRLRRVTKWTPDILQWYIQYAGRESK